jgi:SAM-dependent methyltransferase
VQAEELSQTVARDRSHERLPFATAPRTDSCTYCRSPRVATRYDLGRHQILRCASCGLMYLHPWPTDEELAQVYGDNYFRNPDFSDGNNDTLYGYADYIAERLIKQADYARIARQIRSHLPGVERPRLLEVGCGFGYFLDVCFEEGFDVSGIEFNRHAVERLRQKYQFPVAVGALEQARFDEGQFEAAVMFDVIEHLRDPFSSLDILHHGLVPGGILAVSTMDAESWTSRLLGKRLEDFRRTREHLFFFSRETLSSILERHGFEPLVIRSIGHTFELGFLLERLALYNRPLFRSLQKIVAGARLAQLKIRVNPRTKMVVLARRV